MDHELPVVSSFAKDVALGQRPALPCDSREAGQFSGLDTRTLFAMTAMHGLLQQSGKGGTFGYTGDTTLADRAVGIADAMLVALTKNQ